MNTDQRLVAAATALLDSGGEEAVTLRAVAQASGVSHNAPYKHFKNRDALLAAVAMADFVLLRGEFGRARQAGGEPTETLMQALGVLLQFKRRHPARYRLLFNTPSIAAASGNLKVAALAAYGELVAVVEACQAAGALPAAPTGALAGLLFATMHGLIAIDDTAGGMHPEKGLADVESGLRMLISLMTPQGRVVE